MSRPTLFIAVVASGLVGGVVGGLIVGRTSARPANPRAAAEPPKEADDDELATRVDGLERRLALLERQGSGRRALAAYGAALAGDVPTDGGAQDQQHLENTVRGVIGELDAEREAEREAERAERRHQMAQRTTDTFAAKAQLTQAQRERMTAILEKMMTRPSPSPGDGGYASFREQRKKAREDADRALAEVLDPAQLQQYQTMRDEGELGFGFGGGRRGRRSGAED
ncbi:MAG: hypothetical protein OZ921_20715 [Sorangiineae bacterium]|nr:hypothetical protein [Polyangiaceae bacterium]MEB2324949.1 hypothetical protein [Sorangiineae bacterium]